MGEGNSVLQLDLQLSDEEIYLLGSILAHWGTLEHEVFVQTLTTFDPDSTSNDDLPPKSFNNMQFTETLRHWKERVLGRAEGDRRQVLAEIYAEIERLKSPRDALAHGMWHWSPEAPDVISTVRVSKKMVITTKFDAESLREIASALARLNFRLRYPGGIDDLARERMEIGFHVSRRGFEMLFRKPGVSAEE